MHGDLKAVLLNTEAERKVVYSFWLQSRVGKNYDVRWKAIPELLPYPQLVEG